MKLISSPDEYLEIYRKSVEDPAGFWAEIAGSFSWRRKWDEVYGGDLSRAEISWFTGARLNISENCLDRHLEHQPDKIALIWEPNDPEAAHSQYTYRVLHQKVCKMANVLRNNGIRKGDRVCLYLPMIPELVISILACARIGAVHSVVFAGFSATALADRINDSACRMLITAQTMQRGDKVIDLKKIADQALETCPSIERVLIAGKDAYKSSEIESVLHYELKKALDHCEAEEMDAEDPLFILYTSGSTGKPKGVVHTCAGYMVYAGYSFQQVFQPGEGDIFWCTADIGWVTGHTYITYGPLLMGATAVMFEGVPVFPDPGRFWEVIDKHRVTHFYTAPTAIRSLMAEGDEFPLRYRLDSLKLLGSVGEPINEEAWHWYHEKIGRERCPVVDTWWQTETGGIMISGLGNALSSKPAHAGYPLPGIQPVLLTPEGAVIESNDQEGLLAIAFPWPSMIRTTYGDHERCRQTYFASYPGYYFTGDGARRNAEGMYRIIGRVDDVINVSGHRFGTAEIENAINHHSQVVESAVVGYPHNIKGQGIYAYVIADNSGKDDDILREEILFTVSGEIGKIARPDKIQFVKSLPKTRSGKIMRRILRKIAEGDTGNLGDTSTLLDPSVVDKIKEGML
jgi:acetyl-CoA synthetase